MKTLLPPGLANSSTLTMHPGPLIIFRHGARTMILHLQASVLVSLLDCSKEEHASDIRAALTWPPVVTYPKHKKLHRKWWEWFAQTNPEIGTREDCIARSSALSVNTHANKAGLVEAVTCDLYSFGKHRHHECVCFSVYADHTVHELVVHNDAQTVHTTTSVFYPPSAVVQSALLAAATQGPPLPSTKTGSLHPVQVLRREPRTLGGFPYCPAPRPTAKPDLARRTAIETITKRKHGQDVTYTTTFPDLPTALPNCNDASHYKTYKTDSASACKLDICMWKFIQNFTSTTSHWVTFSDAVGSPIHMDWNTTLFLVSTKHWGVLAKGEKQFDAVKKTTEAYPRMSDLALSYSRFQTSIGLPPPANKPETNFWGKPVRPQGKLVCQNETDCWHWCEEKVHKEHVVLLRVIGLAVSLAMLAGLGMIWSAFCKPKTNDTGRRSFPWEGIQLPELVPEIVEIETAGGPVMEVVLVEEASTAGTFGRAAEEGRGRARVRFFPNDRMPEAALGNDGAPDAVRKVSGREFEVSERGSIRGRVSSGGVDGD